VWRFSAEKVKDEANGCTMSALALHSYKAQVIKYEMCNHRQNMIVGHVAVRPVIYAVLQVVNYNHTLIQHGSTYLKTQGFWVYDLDLLGSCDITGHVTIGLTICGWSIITICPFCTVTEIQSFNDLDIRVT